MAYASFACQQSRLLAGSAYLVSLVEGLCDHHMHITGLILLHILYAEPVWAYS